MAQLGRIHQKGVKRMPQILANLKVSEEQPGP